MSLSISTSGFARFTEFTHLHLASGYSFKYGTAQPDALVAKAAELGMKALFVLLKVARVTE
jgi:hypothetical protein